MLRECSVVICLEAVWQIGETLFVEQFKQSKHKHSSFGVTLD